MERQTVSSRQNPLVKFVCGLAEKKKRTESGLFRLDGSKLLKEAIASDLKIKYVICRAPVSEATEEIIAQAVRNGTVAETEVVYVTENVFEKLSEEHSPEGVITVAEQQNELHQGFDGILPRNTDKILIAESLRDPGNLGTVIRSCYALGIDTLVITDDCAEIYNPRTVRAAMGALFRLPTVTVPRSELHSYIKTLRCGGRRVFAAALSDSSKSLLELELHAGDCFVIGNEGHGLCADSIEACDASVIIPMRVGAESLNAAAAATICIWETVRA